jgi:hypothetical protein
VSFSDRLISNDSKEALFPAFVMSSSSLRHLGPERTDCRP